MKKKLKRLLFFSFLLAVLVIGAILLRDTTPPEVAVTPASGALSAKRPLVVKLTDAGVGLKTVQITATQSGKSTVLFSRDYPAETAVVVETVDPVKAGLEEGPVEFRVQAVDHGHFRFGQGNVTEQSFAFQIDNKPPQIAILSPHHNFNQGGAGMVVFTVSEAVETAGVKLQDLFFPAYRQPSGKYVALFTFPWDMNPSCFVPKVVTVDLAGNERTTGIYFHINPRVFPTDRIEVSQSFLQNKIVPDFQQYFPETTDPLELFLKVNRDLRAKNSQTLLDLGQQSGASPLWQGVFLSQRNAAVPGSFAQRRTYVHNGQVIDHQTHLGIDLASVARAPVQAANAGTIIHADDFGIYGNCVIIDHGLGLQTLYGHLSQISVKTGETVTKGQIIGNTGATGLAGGDHLHFDVLVAGQHVNPLEWWDASWLQNNISDKLALVVK